METNRVKNSVIGSNNDEMTSVIRGFIKGRPIPLSFTPDRDYAEEFALKQTSLSPNGTLYMRSTYYSCQI